MDSKNLNIRVRKSDLKKRHQPVFLKGVELHVATSLGNIETVGMENIDRIPPDAKVIIVVSHISDLDLPAAIKVLGHDFDIVVTAQSSNFNFLENPVGYTVTKIAGMNNFLPVDYGKVAGIQRAEFNPENFTSMNEALSHGKDIVIAGHNPTRNGSLGSGSIGPIYLAQLSGAIILPVAVNLKTDEALGIDGQNKLMTMIKKPDAQVIIGEPIELPPIEGVTDRIQAVMNKRAQKEKVTPDERQQFSADIDKLREQSNRVMSELAHMLPESKRGEYKD